MISKTRYAKLAFVLATGFAPLLMTSCGGEVGVGYGYTTYDPYYYDFHGWPYEEPYYNGWVIDTHRHYRPFHELRPDEQRAYWGWRHSGAAHAVGRPAGRPRR